MPQYLLLIHDRPDRWAALDEAEVGAMMAEYGAITGRVAEAGALRGGAPLARESTLVRVREGARAVTEAPYSDAPEQLNGFYLLELPSLEEAVAFAAEIPSARLGTVEVRELGQM